MNKPVILTAPRISSDLHIGNYFGFLLPMIDMATKRAEDYQVNLFVADLHGLTTPIDYQNIIPLTHRYLKMFVAAGFPLDNTGIHLYRQSHIPAHSELTWILDCFTGMGEMNRMTQFKDKSSKLQEDRINVGLFHYPVLMAADILLYNANYVPVGDDQTQHLEFTRDIAMRLNAKFSQELLTVPYEVKKQHEFFGKDQGLRIKDLVDPTKKMSKSDDTGKGVIFLGDPPETARQKIMSATTDNKAQVKYDPENQPGISNLLQIFALLEGRSFKELETRFSGKVQYSEFKKQVAEKMAEFLSDFQAKLERVNNAEIEAKLASSEQAMNEIANTTLLRVQKAVGLRI